MAEFITTPALPKIYRDILNHKYNGNSSSAQSYDLNPRTSMALQAAPRHFEQIQNYDLSDIEIFAFVHKKEAAFLHREIYSKTEKCWKSLSPIILQTNESIRSLAIWRNLLFIFWDEGRITGVDMNTLVTAISTNPSSARKIYAFVIYNNCIYTFGGCIGDTPSDVVEK